MSAPTRFCVDLVYVYLALYQKQVYMYVKPKGSLSANFL